MRKLVFLVLICSLSLWNCAGHLRSGVVHVDPATINNMNGGLGVDERSIGYEWKDRLPPHVAVGDYLTFMFQEPNSGTLSSTCQVGQVLFTTSTAWYYCQAAWPIRVDRLANGAGYDRSRYTITKSEVSPHINQSAANVPNKATPVLLVYVHVTEQGTLKTYRATFQDWGALPEKAAMECAFYTQNQMYDLLLSNISKKNGAIEANFMISQSDRFDRDPTGMGHSYASTSLSSEIAGQEIFSREPEQYKVVSFWLDRAAYVQRLTQKDEGPVQELQCRQGHLQK